MLDGIAHFVSIIRCLALRKLLLLFFICLWVSCENRQDHDLSQNDTRGDSVGVYLDKAKDKTLPLNLRKKAIDRVLVLVEKQPLDTMFPLILYQKSLIHFSAGEYDSLLNCHQRFIDLTPQHQNDSILAEQHYLMGYYFNEITHSDSKAVFYYTKSKEYFERIKDSQGIAKNLLTIGTIQKDKNDFFGSKETLVEALKFLNVRKDRNLMAYAYNVLATDHRKLLNLSDAITYYNRAIATTDSEKDKLLFKNNLAVTYMDDNSYDKAIATLSGIQEDSLWLDNQIEKARVLDNLAYARWLAGHAVSAEDFKVPLHLRKQNKDRRGQIASYTHLGEYYAQSKPPLGKRYFDSVIQLSKLSKIPRAEKDALKFLMRLEPDNVQFHDRYIALQDSLYAQELQVKTQFAKYKYDDRIKQESIQSLELENTQRAMEASRQRAYKIMYLGGVFFMISVLGFTFFIFVQRTKRLKQANKIARLEAIHDTEAELSRKIHDDHGAELNKAMLMVQNDVDKSVVLDSLEKLYHRSRDLAREINEVDTGPHFWEGLVAMLTFRTPNTVKLFLSGGKEIDWASVAGPTKTVLYKVLQELMINLARHSDANAVAITFQIHEKNLLVGYEDDGAGATQEALVMKNGLRNTEKRIQAIHGSIIFDTEKNGGFRAEIQIPIK